MKGTQIIHNKPLLSFKDFIAIMFFAVERTKFEFMPFHLEIINELQKYFYKDSEEKNNLAINIPPRWGKSVLATYFIAYGLTYFPDSLFIYTSFSKSLSCKKGIYELLRILENKTYSELFGTLKLKKRLENEIITEHEGIVYAVSTGQPVTGSGAGRMRKGFSGAIIIDDPIKPMDAFSKIYRERNVRWYTNTLKSRKNSPSVPTIAIMQRVNTEDLCGFIEKTESDEWKFYKKEAVINGSSIWEKKKTTRDLEKMRIEDPFTFYSQYQQVPIVAGGSVIKTEWIQFFNTIKDKTFKALYFVVDTAQDTKSSADYSVILYVGVTSEGDVYILDMKRGKYSFPDLKRLMVELYNSSSANIVYIENKASGIPLQQELREARVPVSMLNPTRDKYTRLMQEIDMIACGYLFIPEFAQWRGDFLHECETFREDMSHQNDDIIDCIVYALNVARSRHNIKDAKNDQ